MNDINHPNEIDDKLSNTLLQLAQDGMIVINGNNIHITEKGRQTINELNKNNESKPVYN